MEKGCKNHRETLYSSKGKIVYVVIFTVMTQNANEVITNRQRSLHIPIIGIVSLEFG